MSEEEKEALENLEHIVKYWKPDDINDELANIEYNSIKVTVELIDKLQKENEELKEENFDQVYMKAIADYKEKIRTKIKELEDKCEDIKKKEYTGTYALCGNYLEAFYQIVILKELLGETKDEE